MSRPVWASTDAVQPAVGVVALTCQASRPVPPTASTYALGVPIAAPLTAAPTALAATDGDTVAVPMAIGRSRLTDAPPNCPAGVRCTTKSPPSTGSPRYSRL